MDPDQAELLRQTDHAHAWHPFTPMRQWREKEPVIIEYGAGSFLIDTEGRRYIDGVSSLWCNVHGHRVASIDAAVKRQLDHVAHSTMLGLSNVPATELAGRLAACSPGVLNKVFYSDAGATATELAFKMAVGFWYHQGQPQRNTLLAIEGAYHGDTVGSMSVGYSPTFHKPFETMVFDVTFAPAPQMGWRDSDENIWPLDDAERCERVRDQALRGLEEKLLELGDRCAAVVIEPLVQGAAGLVMQPPGYLRGVAELAEKHGVLLIADEVATGFGRTGTLFACEQEEVCPDIMCLGKGITGGYLPLAATLASDAIAQVFEGELEEHRTLYHGHTYTGNCLAAAAANASLDLFESGDLLQKVRAKGEQVDQWLEPLRDKNRFGCVADVRRRGLMVGIELSVGDQKTTGFDPSRRLGTQVAEACREKGLLIRPLGNVVVLMPPLSISHDELKPMVEIVVEQIAGL